MIMIVDSLLTSLLLPGRSKESGNATIRMLDKIETELSSRVKELTPYQIGTLGHFITRFANSIDYFPAGEEFFSSLDVNQRQTLSFAILLGELATE